MSEDVRESLEMMKHHCGEAAFRKIAGEALEEITRLRQQVSREKQWNEERRSFAGQMAGVVESLDNVESRAEIVAALREVADRNDGCCRTDQ